MDILHPTLWRTCRVLANPRRLRVLRAVVAAESIHVTAVARGCSLPLSSATLMLRALQARGLLSARRDGTYVRYAAQADPLVAHSNSVLQLMRTAFDRGVSDASIVKALTGFTHVRRILVVRALRAGGMPARRISTACGISMQALYRHLSKLERRGFVRSVGRDGWALAAPRDFVGEGLLQLATRD